jgi:hypothetical protein
MSKRAINLVGRIFGNWEVVACAGKNKHGKIIWTCLCACGKKSDKPTTGDLLRGRTKGCGCSREGLRKRPYEHLLTKLKREAKHRSLEATLTYEDFFYFTDKVKCHYCDTTLLWEKYGNGSCPVKGRYNLDRKDNAKGYSKDNCVVCCGICNQIKSDRFTYEQMLQIGLLIKSWRVK